MKIQVSHGADPRSWFVVLPMPHDNADSNAEQVASLLRAHRTVYEINAQPWKGDLRTDLADILAAAVTTDGAHHKQHDLEQIAALLGIELPGHLPLYETPSSQTQAPDQPQHPANPHDEQPAPHDTRRGTEY